MESIIPLTGIGGGDNLLHYNGWINASVPCDCGTRRDESLANYLHPLLFIMRVQCESIQTINTPTHITMGGGEERRGGEGRGGGEEWSGGEGRGGEGERSGVEWSGGEGRGGEGRGGKKEDERSSQL